MQIERLIWDFALGRLYICRYPAKVSRSEKRITCQAPQACFNGLKRQRLGQYEFDRKGKTAEMLLDTAADAYYERRSHFLRCIGKHIERIRRQAYRTHKMPRTFVYRRNAR